MTPLPFYKVAGKIPHTPTREMMVEGYQNQKFLIVFETKT